MNQLIGFLLVALSLVLAVIVIGPFELLLDVYGLFMLIGCIFGVTILSYGSQAFRIFQYANKPVTNQKEYFWVISFFDNLINTSLITGIIGSLIGFVSILSSLDDVSELNAATSVSLLSLLYGFIFAKLVFSPLKQNVLRRAQVANINANVQRQIEQNTKLSFHFYLLALTNLVVSFLLIHWIL